MGHHIFRVLNKKYTETKINIFEYDIPNNIGGTFCYIINKSGASKFLNFIQENGIRHGIDYLMFHYYKEMNLKQYQVVPPLAFSECVRTNNTSDSDIQYDRTKLF